MLKELRPALVLFAIFTVVTGLLYPALITGVAQVAMPYQANGSLMLGQPGDACSDADPCAENAMCVDGACRTVLGSELIGQPFDDPKYFWSRPSVTAPTPYNGASSVGSNHGAINPALIENVEGRVAALREADPGNERPVPVDLVTASASGLDPHITPAGALYQVPRVARVRGLSEENVERLVNEHIETRTLGVLGEPRVNVVLLNRALDRLARSES
jgi:K+-transporting ATPase ATPase C chain